MSFFLNKNIHKFFQTVYINKNKLKNILGINWKKYSHNICESALKHWLNEDYWRTFQTVLPLAL